MKTIGKIWDMFSLLVTVYAFLYVAYVAVVVTDPTNEQLANCILYAMCILLIRINALQKSSEE